MSRSMWKTVKSMNWRHCMWLWLDIRWQTIQQINWNYDSAYQSIVFIISGSLKDTSPKNENSVIIYSPSSRSKPVWMSLFCWTQRKIFWRMWETEQFWGTIDFHSIFFSYYGSQWCPKTAWLQTFFKISYFVFGSTKKFIQVWNYLRVSKWWQNFHFWVNYPLSSFM